MTYILLVLFAILLVYDGYSTIKVLGQGGTELSPLVAWIIKYLGVELGTVISRVVLLLIVALPSLWLLQKGIESYVLIFVVPWYCYKMWQNHKAIK